MSEFYHKTSIPSESDAKGIFCDSTGAFYFASHTNIFRTKGRNTTLYTSVEHTITGFTMVHELAFITTAERVYMNKQGRTVGSLKRSATAIAANEDILVLGINSMLEVWEIPKAYKFTLFKNRHRKAGHHSPITSIKIINNNTALTASEDCTVRLFSFSENTSVILAKTRRASVDLEILDDRHGIVTDKSGVTTLFVIPSQINVESDDLMNNKHRAEYERLVDLSADVLASSADGATLAVISELKEEVMVKTENTEFFHHKKDDEIPDILKEEEEKRKITKIISKDSSSRLTVFKMNELRKYEEIFKCDIPYRAESIVMRNYNVLLKSKNFVGVFNIPNETFSESIVLPKIVCFDMNRRFIAAGCQDRRVALYLHNTVNKIFSDEKATSPILGVHLIKNMCITTYTDGHISVFNTTDGNCFRSFKTVAQNLSYTHSAVDEDGKICFIASLKQILVCDIQRSRVIDDIKLECPLVELIFSNGFLYYLGIEGELVKYNLYNGKSVVLTLGKAVGGFAVDQHKIIVSSGNELVFYNTDFNYLGGMRLTIAGRHRDEVFSKEKPVEKIGFNSKQIFCGGRANMLKVVDYGAEMTLYKNNVAQILQVSRNKDWENYKAKLSYEKETPFNKGQFIEVRKIIAEEGKLVILTREGLKVFSKDGWLFNPVEFGIEASEEFVRGCISRREFISALIGALKLNNFRLISEVLAKMENFDGLFRFVPDSYVNLLGGSIFEILKADFSNMKMLELLNELMRSKRSSGLENGEGIRTGLDGIYTAVKNNYYLLKSIVEKPRDT
ncbi:periodic tryptophan protein 2 [Enteropsectra breve]|nr:periodic tryptophan protein 2 [Enteropsectra breve]